MRDFPTCGSRVAPLAALLVATVALAAEPLVQFQVLSRLEFRSSKPIFTAINSQDEWMAFRKLRQYNSSDGTPLEQSNPVSNLVSKIDFKQYTLLVANAGIKANSGYSMAFVSVRDFDAMIVVDVVDIGPGGCPTLQQISYPQAFALISKSTKPVKFIVSHAAADCNRRDNGR